MPTPVAHLQGRACGGSPGVKWHFIGDMQAWQERPRAWRALTPAPGLRSCHSS
jgi:hypothetical protein